MSAVPFWLGFFGAGLAPLQPGKAEIARKIRPRTAVVRDRRMSSRRRARAECSVTTETFCARPLSPKNARFSDPCRPFFGNVAFYIAVSIQEDSQLGVDLAAGNFVCVCPTMRGLISPHQEFDSVEVQSTIPNRSGDSNPFLASGRKKFNLNLRSQGQIGKGEQAHPDIAEIDAQSIHPNRSLEHLNGGVQQLALPPTPVWFGVAFENHLLRPRGQGSAAIFPGEGYGGSAPAIVDGVLPRAAFQQAEDCWCSYDLTPTSS